ncbi:MAG: FAD:protein FMN transferase [Verrucomicrobiota bacterium]
MSRSATAISTGFSPSSDATARRCQPLLGTYVEIAASGPEGTVSLAITRAFDAIRRVQGLMSHHDPASELSRVNREAWRCPVPVHPWTLRVLRSARQLSGETHGAFDPTPPTHGQRGRAGTWEDVELRPDGRIRFRRPLQLDLGGIAKGFAVDRAVEVLRRLGMTRGWVNAGGDLRSFGGVPRTVHLRHPVLGAVLSESLPLGDAALATSAPTFTFGALGVPGRRGLLDPRSRSPLNAPRSVTVLAPTCLWADALTKVVWVLGTESAPVLRRHRARAWVLETS